MKRLTVVIVLFCSALFADQLDAGPDPAYYETVDQSSSQAMRDSLHEIIDDHLRFPYDSSETDTWDILKIADENPENSSHVISIYRNASFAKQNGVNFFYNREHTWPKEYGFPDNDPDLNYPYSDMHHLFLAAPDYNLSRAFKPYDNCDSACLEKVTETNNERGGVGGAYPGDSNWTDGGFTNGRWEPWVGRRGDVARALMYMDLRYAGGTHGITGTTEPDLILTDDLNLIDQSNTGDNEPVGYMGLLSVLLQWHEQDPVDLIEIQHHETVASFQGNRNPFIDHPEWAACLFKDECDAVPTSCDTNFVTLNDHVITVAPSGVDDTVNIQCALDLAAKDGYSTVKLSANTYTIRKIVVENFKGTLEGVSKASTTITVLNHSIECGAMVEAGLTASVIKFASGEPRMRFMTIRAGQPCKGSDQIEAVLHFTGSSAMSKNCASDVIFGVLDRLIIESSTDILSGPSKAILVSAESNQLGGCKDTLLGSFKLNRSYVSGFFTGLQTSMKSGAQLDVNFNNFEDNINAIWLHDTNQNTTITNNKINVTDASTTANNGVVIRTQSPQAPGATRVVINKNEFTVSSSSELPTHAIEGAQTGRVANVSVVITNNIFNLTGSKTRGISLRNISNAHVSVNRFIGGAQSAVFASGSTPVSDWTITANNGLGDFDSANSDIFLDQKSSRCIVGKGQNATVEDLGSDNTILPQH